MPIARQTACAPPAGAWQPGWMIRASTWSGCTQRDEEVPLRTLANAGDLAPLASPPPWSFHLGLGTLLGPPSVRLLANGMLFSFPQSDPDAYVDLLTLSPGVVLGHAQMRINPSLFCPEAELDEGPGFARAQVAGQAIVLRTRQQNDLTVFCLAVSTKGMAAAEAAAEQGLDHDLPKEIEKEVELRSAFWNHHRRVGRDQRSLSHAFERLIYLLEPPGANLPGWWVNTGTAGFSLRGLHGLVRAWLDADAAVAVRLVRTVLEALPPSGALPASLHPALGPQSDQSTWPMLTSCVWSLGKAPGGAAFMAEALPRLRDYLTWALSYFDPQGRGTPAWRQAGESITPDTFDNQICSAGLAGLLLHEIDLFFQMLDQHTDLELDTAEISLGRENMEEHLLNALWDAESGIFRDRYIGGEPVMRITFSCVLPLLWSGLEAQHRGALLRHLQPKGTLHRRSGWAAWQAWEDDPMGAPIFCEHQVLLLDRVRELHHATAVQMGGQIAETLRYALAEGGTFPLRLDPGESSDDANVDDPSELPGACLLILCSTPLLEPHPEKVAKVASTLDKHRTAVAAVCMGAVLALLGALAFNLWRGGEWEDEASTAAFGVTEQLIASRQFDQARQSLAGMEGRARKESIAFYSGLIAFHQGHFAEAEQFFQAAADAGWRHAESRMNLALSMFRQGKLEEAAAMYDDIVQQFDAGNPQLAQLARAAGNIIRENNRTLSQRLQQPH